MATGLVGSTLGDVIAQNMAGSVLPFDPLRTLRFAAWGCLVASPAGHAWYGVLDKHVCPTNPKSVR